MQSRADLHVHSKYSDRPSEWFLRRIGAPESFVEPLEVYRRAKAKGMDFVTISDHNCIRGALEIAHLDDTFLSTEVTTYFPEDGCKVHFLVSGIDEAQFRDIQEVRPNIYDLRKYVMERDIVYSVTHPLYAVNDRLSVNHVERLLVLFNRFEGINGMREPRAGNLMNVVLSSLTPALVEELADQHGIDPWGPCPWQKTLTGGSDDHSGIHVAGAYTVTPKTRSVPGFLRHLRNGNHDAGGEHGTSLKLGYSFYVIAYSYYKSRFMGASAGKPNLIGEMLKKLIEETPDNAKPSAVRKVVTRVVMPWKKRRMSSMERLLVDEFTELFGKDDGLFLSENGTGLDRRSFRLASRISQQLSYSILRKLLTNLEDGSFLESLQALISLGPVVLSIAPYLASFATQHKDARLLQAVSTRFGVRSGLTYPSDRKAWITDTFCESSGVARKIIALADCARRHGFELAAVTSLEREPEHSAPGLELTNFRPVGVFTLPDSGAIELAFPPFLEIVEFLEREQFAEIVVSTPGPLGLVAVSAARLLGIRVTGVYHTDFPQYVHSLSEDDTMVELTRRYMSWYFGLMDRVVVPSEWYRRELVEYGCPADKLELLAWGVDNQHFHPDKRETGYWRGRGGESDFTFIYVGRVSAQRNLDILIEAFCEFRKSRRRADLAVVGDGPFLEQLRKRYRKTPGLIFTGLAPRRQLPAAYASADVFVFPGTSATFGNVVLEAQASGLPVIVPDRGGPRDLVQEDRNGLIVDVEQRDDLVGAMIRLFDDAELRRRFSEEAVRNSHKHSWTRVVDALWQPETPLAPPAAAPADPALRAAPDPVAVPV